MTNVTFMLSYFNLLLFIIFKRIVGKTANINMDEMHIFLIKKANSIGMSKIIYCSVLLGHYRKSSRESPNSSLTIVLYSVDKHVHPIMNPIHSQMYFGPSFPFNLFDENV